MAKLAYIKKTLKRGDIWIKLVKAGRLFRFIGFRLTGKNIGGYPTPPGNLEEIGFFDKRLLIHTKDPYRRYFQEKNLHQGGDYQRMDHKLVSLVLHEDSVLIKKRFEDFKRHYEFYNELICLHRLRKTGIVPKIYFVDYKNYTIYMEYISGDVMLPVKRDGKKDVGSDGSQEIRNGFQNSLQKMHENGIVLYDMAGHNMMRSSGNFYFIDFADAIYNSRLLKSRFNKMKMIEVKQMEGEISKYLSLR